MALMSGTTAILQPPVGFLVDKHGARKFLVGGTLLMTLTTGMIGHLVLADFCNCAAFGRR